MSTLNILATDQLQTPLSLLGAGGQLRSAYTPYGYRPAQSSSPLLGFSGQLHERELGWYLLGNGYRAFNPKLMRFHSPDRLSPFGKGGINAYAYCEGDPVNWQDISGRQKNRLRRVSHSTETISGENNSLYVQNLTDPNVLKQLRDIGQAKRDLEKYISDLQGAITNTEYIVETQRSPRGEPHSVANLERLTELARLYEARANYNSELIALEYKYEGLKAQLTDNVKKLREVGEMERGYDKAILGIEKRAANEIPPAYAWRHGSF